MRFQLPQFIETETKIVGPFTLKQFLWVAGGASFVFLLFTLTSGVVFFALAIPIGGLFLAFAFVRIDDMPLIMYVAYALSFATGTKKYIFKKDSESNDQFSSTNFQ